MAGTMLSAKKVALVVTFTALYVIFGFIKLSPIIGLPGYAITAAAMMAPVIGVLLGPYVGTLSTLFGGTIGLFVGSFSALSVASGVASSLCSGLLHRGKRILAVLIYLSLFLALAFYPDTGPVWIFPAYTWFQILGLIILISPLQSLAMRNFSRNASELLYAFFVTSLIATMAGQIAGTLVFETYQFSMDTYLGTWISTSFWYPVERTIIALGSALIGTALFKALSPSVLPILAHLIRSEKRS